MMKPIKPQEKMMLKASMIRMPKRTRKRNPAINADNAMQKLSFMMSTSIARVKTARLSCLYKGNCCAISGRKIKLSSTMP